MSSRSRERRLEIERRFRARVKAKAAPCTITGCTGIINSVNGSLCKNHVRKQRNQLNLAAKQKELALQRTYRHTEIVKQRKWVITLRRRYGLTPKGFRLLLMAQGRGCAICGQPDGETWTSRLRIDHHHQHEYVRGLLCNRCNRALGLFQDNPEILEKAATYLRETAEAKGPRIFARWKQGRHLYSDTKDIFAEKDRRAS